MRTKGSRSSVPGWIGFFNPVVKLLMAAGVPMGPDVLMTVRGRRTGLPRSTPVAIAEVAGREWLLSPFGDVDWARNLRAAGHATIRSGRRRYEIDATALDRDDKIAFFRDVLEPYLQTHRVVGWIVRRVDGIPDDPIAAADGCEVFQVTRTA
jgi:deazaflavin-dependent oxidoreductase (nitroreductase family)